MVNVLLENIWIWIVIRIITKIQQFVASETPNFPYPTMAKNSFKQFLAPDPDDFQNLLVKFLSKTKSLVKFHNNLISSFHVKLLKDRQTYAR